jgi:DNA-binding transcriptional LysR family regulator
MGNRHQVESWDNYRYFLAVAREGSLLKASAHMGTDHTTVSRHVRALEQEVGGALFHRSNTGYQLTELGRKILDVAEIMESAQLRGRTEPDGLVAGTVRVGAPDGIGSLFLAPRMKKLIERHPDLIIELIATARVFNLAKREADIAIGLSPPSHVRVVYKRLIDYNLFMYASADYLKHAPRIRGVADLRRHPFIGYVQELLFAPEMDYLRTIGCDVTTRIRSTNLVAQAQAVAAGAGLGIFPPYVASTLPNLVPVLADEVVLTRTIHMHIHEDRRLSPDVRAVADFIVAEIAENRRLFEVPADADGRKLDAAAHSVAR